MKEKFDDIAQLIDDAFLKEAQEEELKQENLEQKELVQEQPETLPEDRKDQIKRNIDEQIGKYEKEKVYATLSDEDREALELGRKIQEKRSLRKKKPWRLYGGVAAMLIMIMAIGVTSIGGPGRIVKMFTQKVGDREVSQVDSAKDSALSAEELEEEAYQQIKDELQIEPVRIWIRPDGMKFDRVSCNSEWQTAEVIYQYEKTYVTFYMNVLYSDSSWGVDIEDKETDKWEELVQGCTIEIKEYEEARRKEKRYAAEFEFQGVKYFINATMDKEQFSEIIKNLYFL